MKIDNHILAAVGVNGVSSSMTPLIHNLQPVLSAILTAVQIIVAVVTVMVLLRQYKQKNKDE